MSSQAVHGAAASCGPESPAAASAASQAATIGRQYPAARYSCRGGQPRNQARVTA